MGTIEMVKKEIRKMLKAQGASTGHVGGVSKIDHLPNTRRIGQENKKIRNTKKKI